MANTDVPLLSARRMLPPKIFHTLFFEKIDSKSYPGASHISSIYGISVSDDNLIWVNHLGKCVKLLQNSGDILQTFNLDICPVFSCCTSSGDLLVTQGHSPFSKPVITLISRNGNTCVLADFSFCATNLSGIMCEKETIFVIAYTNKPGVHKGYKGYFVVKLGITGQVEGFCYTEKKFNYVNHINQIVSLNGQVFVFRSRDSTMLPLKGEVISSEGVNALSTHNTYSASASVDNLGNVIIGSTTGLVVIHPGLEIIHKIEIDIDETVFATAVDKNNQLWLGTASGNLYSAHYLK
jgi:hypothetical protein